MRNTTRRRSTFRSAMPTGIPLSNIWPRSITALRQTISPFTRRLVPTSRFFGRIHRDKGLVAAINAAEQAGIPLRIAGIIQDELYFKREIAPRIDGDRVQYIGPVLAEDRSSFLGGAIALLHLIDFDEPFGFSVVEAMACGTPVIAFDRGSMSEIIGEGVTGTVVADLAAATEAIRGVSQLDRQSVRAEAVRRFSSDRMVDEYVTVYRRAVTEFTAEQPRGSSISPSLSGVAQL